MDLKRILRNLADIVAEEAATNPSFRERIEAAMGVKRPEPKSETSGDGERRKGRRPPALLDPVDLARKSESDLRSRLAELDLERLLDVVAQYGMDPGKLVMKWKDRERVIDKIVETSISRATKGDAFRID